VIVALAVLVMVWSIALRLSQRREETRGRAPETVSAEGTIAHDQASSDSRSRLQHRRTARSAEQPLAEASPESELQRVLRGEAELPKLSREDIDKYLQQKQRTAESLLGAYLVSHDLAYLMEAAANFPNDPKVQLSVLVSDDFPEQRRKWVDLFKASAPDNSLGDYLSAREYFKSGQTEAALRELQEAGRKTSFNDYALETKLSLEEMYMLTGRSPLESKLSAWSADLLPALATFKGLAVDIAGLEKQYLSAGDARSAQQLAQMGLGLADRFKSGDGAKFLISQLVGIAAESIALGPLDANASYDFLGGKTPKDRLEEIKQQRSALSELARRFGDARSTMTDNEALSYLDRMKLYGESEAMRWLVEQRSGQ
jgi:hypothetical protein